MAAISLREGPKIAVYTSVFGGFENVWPPVRPESSHSHYLVTDSLRPVKGWTSRTSSNSKFANSRLSNRQQKMLFQQTLSEYDFSVYIDANVRPSRSLQPLFEHFIASGADIGLYPHYARSSVHDEVKACINRSKVTDRKRLSEEIAFYSSQGFPDASGMWEGSVIFKNHRSEKLSGAMREWWDLYETYQSRDQFSLPFVVWKHGLTIANLDLETKGRDHYFIRLQHSSSGIPNRIARHLHARSVENVFWHLAYRALRALARG